MEILYNIYYDMINNYEDKYRNYDILRSLNSIYDNSIIDDLKKINKIEFINSKFERIMQSYKMLNYYEISLEYNFND